MHRFTTLGSVNGMLAMVMQTLSSSSLSLLLLHLDSIFVILMTVNFHSLSVKYVRTGLILPSILSLLHRGRLGAP